MDFLDQRRRGEAVLVVLAGQCLTLNRRDPEVRAPRVALPPYSRLCSAGRPQATWAELVALYRLTMDAPPHNLRPRYNVCPMDPVDVGHSVVIGCD